VSIVRLTILGCSGSIPGPNQAASGYLVEADGFTLGMDLGNGTLAQLQAMRDPFTLDALLLSHLHPDHCADVSALTVLRRYHPAPPFDVSERKLPVYAPAEAPSRLANAYAPDEDERRQTDLSDVFEFHPLRAGALRIGPFALTASVVDHPTETFGARISHGGRVLAYTGDTGPCKELDALAREADVLLAEASWTEATEGPAGMHLSGRQAGELAARTGVGRLLLTHVPPWTDRLAVRREAAAAFAGPVELVEQGGTHEV
jgi:ribonuclease BN (tRNA processing enzyme)